VVLSAIVEVVVTDDRRKRIPWIDA